MTETLSDQAEMMLRQIHPSCLHDGNPASDQFTPREQDAGKMSIDRGALVSASIAHARYVASGQRKSAAVYGLTVGEFAAENIVCLPDPQPADEQEPKNPAHALADFNAHPDNKRKTVGKRLKRLAVARGRLHP